MLSEHGNSRTVATPIDGRYDATREARADARYAARVDARAMFICHQRGGHAPVEPRPAVLRGIARKRRNRR